MQISSVLSNTQAVQIEADRERKRLNNNYSPAPSSDTVSISREAMDAYHNSQLDKTKTAVGIEPTKVEVSENEETESGHTKTDSGLSSFGPNVPEEVKDAWNNAVAETGTNGLGITSSGKLEQITAMLVLKFEQSQSTGSSDFLGNTTESAIIATEKALERLTNPLSQGDYEQKHYEKEKSFYESFLKHLKSV